MPLYYLAILVLLEEVLSGLSLRFFGIGGGVLLLLISLWATAVVIKRSRLPRLLALGIFVLSAILPILLVSSLAAFHRQLIAIWQVPAGLLFCYALPCRVPSLSLRQTIFLHLLVAAPLALSFILPNLDIYSFIVGASGTRLAGLYSEPSHASFYFAFLYYVCSSSNKRHAVYYLIALLFLNASVFTLTGLVLSLGALADFLINYAAFRIVRFLTVVIFIVIAVTVLSVPILNAYVYDRVGPLFSGLDYSIITNISLSAWLYTWKLILHFLPGSVFGFGLGNYSYVYDNFSFLFPSLSPGIFSTNGGFLLAQLVIEYGIVFTLIFLILYYRLFSPILSVGLISATAYLLFRGWGASVAVFYSYAFCARIFKSRHVFSDS